MNKKFVFFNSFDVDIRNAIDYNEIVRNHNFIDFREVTYALSKKRSKKARNVFVSKSNQRIPCGTLLVLELRTEERRT